MRAFNEKAHEENGIQEKKATAIARINIYNNI